MRGAHQLKPSAYSKSAILLNKEAKVQQILQNSVRKYVLVVHAEW